MGALYTAILALLDGQPGELAVDNQYHALWHAIMDGVAQGGVSVDEDDREGEGDSETATWVAAIRAFVEAESLTATIRVVEQQQDILFDPAVEQIFRANIAQAKANGDEQFAAYLQQHLDLLTTCQRYGIAATFAALVPQTVGAQDEDGDEGIELPFDPALITQTIAALRGSPQDRLMHLQKVLPLAAQANDPAQRAFWNAVQMALVGGDLREVGRGLSGVYAQLWTAVVAGVTGDGPPDLLTMLVHNTLAVLGPAAAQRDQWRSDLEQLHDQAAAEGARGFADLVEALLALLAAGGNPAGLGAGLEGPFAGAWREIVAKLGRG